MTSRIPQFLACSMLVIGATACAPKTAPPPKAANAEISRTWSDRSTTFMAAGSLNEGLEAADQALRYDAGNITAWENKIVSLIALEDWTAALKAADQALALEPGNTTALTNKAIALTNLHRCDEAAAARQRAMKAMPESSALWYDQARCEAVQGRREQALQSLAKAIALDPKQKAAARAEEDLQSLRSTPEFIKLVQE